MPVSNGLLSTARPDLLGLPLYVLIDPYLGDYPEHGQDVSQCSTFDSLRAIRREAWQGLDIHLAENDDPVDEACRLPYVVDLSRAGDSVIDDLTAVAMAEHQSALEGEIQRYRIGAFIETWMRPQDLMLRLQKMWRYRSNTHDFRYLRIADRRVFEALTHLFEPAAVAHWLGPIAHWHLLGRDFRWLSLEGNAESWYTDAGLGRQRTVDAARTLDGATLKVSAQQHWRLFDLEAVSRALLEWQASGRTVDEDAYRTAWDGVQEAARLGLQEPADKAAFTFCWMRNPDCATCLPVSRALKLSRGNGDSFAAILARLEIDELDGVEPVN